jgi:hypothetical protein
MIVIPLCFAIMLLLDYFRLTHREVIALLIQKSYATCFGSLGSIIRTITVTQSSTDECVLTLWGSHIANSDIKMQLTVLYWID